MEHKPEEFIGYWIKKLDRTMKNAHDKKLQQYDLTLSQGSVLHQLWTKDGLTQKEIQENLGMRGASVSGLVDTLLKKGLISRQQDEEDARFKRLYLTEEGSKLEDLSLSVINELEGTISQGFSEEEKVILICWLKKLYNNLYNLEK